MQISMELPDIPGVDHRYLTEALVAMLYHTGKLSEKQACYVLSMTRRAFEEMFPRFGFAILVNSQENLDIELHA